MGEVVYAPQFGGRPSRAERVGTVARVLIVDSDPATLAAASQALQSEGHATATAFDALAAISVAERLGPFDLLVTDVGAIDGIALANTLRQRDSNLQVLYVMNRDNPLVDEHQAIERPFSESELVDAVSSLLYWQSPRSTR